MIPGSETSLLYPRRVLIQGADIGPRSLAFTLDFVVEKFLIWVVLGRLVLSPIYFALLPESIRNDFQLADQREAVLLVIFGLATLFYYASFESLLGATPCKMALGLRVVDEGEGARPGFRQAFIRNSYRMFLPVTLAAAWVVAPEPRIFPPDRVDPLARAVPVLAYILVLLSLGVSIRRSNSWQGWHDRRSATVVSVRQAMTEVPS